MIYILWVNILASFYPEHPLKVRPKSVSCTLYYGILVTFMGAPFVNRRYTKGVHLYLWQIQGGARGASPLFLDQTKAQREEENLF